MKGAREYFNIIRSAHYRKLDGLEETKLGYRNHGGDARCYRSGNILYVTASHARGKTLHIYLIDENEELFQVYGVTGGNSGWTETYGWTHKGTWVKPILQQLKNLSKAIDAHDEELASVKREREREENKQIGAKVEHFNQMFRMEA